jgi:hypothetical protein
LGAAGVQFGGLFSGVASGRRHISGSGWQAMPMLEQATTPESRWQMTQRSVHTAQPATPDCVDPPALGRGNGSGTGPSSSMVGGGAAGGGAAGAAAGASAGGASVEGAPFGDGAFGDGAFGGGAFGGGAFGGGAFGGGAFGDGVSGDVAAAGDADEVVPGGSAAAAFIAPAAPSANATARLTVRRAGARVHEPPSIVFLPGEPAGRGRPNRP